MDKRYGRSEQRFDADYRTGRKTDRQENEKRRNNKGNWNKNDSRKNFRTGDSERKNDRSGGSQKNEFRNNRSKNSYRGSGAAGYGSAGGAQNHDYRAAGAGSTYRGAVSNTAARKPYRRPRPDRQFTNIDDYLKDRDQKFGKTIPDGAAEAEPSRNEAAEGRRAARGSGKGHDLKKHREEKASFANEDQGETRKGAYSRTGNREQSAYSRAENCEQDAFEASADDEAVQGGANEADRGFEDENRIEGRNSVTEAFRAGRTVDRLYVQEGLNDGPIATIRRMAKKQGTSVSYVPKERLNAMSQTGHHQGVIAVVASYGYASVEEILEKAKSKGEEPFIIVLDGIEDPHNLGAIIRTANLAGAHGVIIGKHRAAGLTAAVVRASAGALNYTPVAKVTNLAAAIDELKKDGMWFVCADMNGTDMYDLEMKGSVGLVIGNEGSGVSRLIREKCDFTAKIPMRGDIDSLNASVAAGILSFEIARQRES
jgi:23S rRNA (guanosine2251-2'-O)-methyltransferase